MKRFLLILICLFTVTVSGQSKADEIKAKAYYSAGKRSNENNNFKEALQQLDKAVEIFGKTNASIEAQRGVALIGLQRWEEANTAFDRVYNANPSDATIEIIAPHLSKLEQGLKKERERKRIAFEKERERKRIALEKERQVLEEERKREAERKRIALEEERKREAERERIALEEKKLEAEWREADKLFKEKQAQLLLKETKIAFININDVFVSMQEVKDVKKELERIKAVLSEQSDDKYKSTKDHYLYMKEKRLLTSLQDKLEKVIKEEAEHGGYNYVFNKDIPISMFKTDSFSIENRMTPDNIQNEIIANGTDLQNIVKHKLGIATVINDDSDKKVYFNSTIAHINISELLNETPEFKTFNMEMEKLQRALNNDANALIAKREAKFQKFRNEAPYQSEELNRKREIVLQQDKDSINKFIEKNNIILLKKQSEQSEVLKITLKKVLNNVILVARRQGYEYVLNITNDTTLVANGKDLYEDVKVKLGISN